MTSSGLPISVLDIERFPAEFMEEYSLPDDEKKPRSLPLSQINWEAYCKTGNKASFVWLFCLFFILGCVIEQASLTTYTMRTTALPSSYDGSSSFSPPHRASSSFLAARKRKMTEVTNSSLSNEQNSSISTRNNKNTNKVSNEATSTNDEIQRLDYKQTTPSLGNKSIPVSSNVTSSINSNSTQKVATQTN